jgi:hypothetical protein
VANTDIIAPIIKPTQSEWPSFRKKTPIGFELPPVKVARSILCSVQVAGIIGVCERRLDANLSGAPLLAPKYLELAREHEHYESGHDFPARVGLED